MENIISKEEINLRGKNDGTILNLRFIGKKIIDRTSS